MNRNQRLLFVFRLCSDLGIDDPASWMNAAPAKVVDQWIAYYTILADKESGTTEMMSPSKALEKLQASHGR